MTLLIVCAQLTDEEKAKMKQALEFENPDGTTEKRVLEEILSRRKSKNTYEYEVREALCGKKSWI